MPTQLKMFVCGWKCVCAACRCREAAGERTDGVHSQQKVNGDRKPSVAVGRMNKGELGDAEEEGMQD